MKKIINGKAYNTKTAKLIGEIWDETCHYPDVDWWQEALFLKKTGEFFLYCQGGPDSKHEKDGRWGEKIIPMTESMAKSWAEENMSGDEYEEIFGEVEE